MARLILDCDGVDVITHELTGEITTIGRVPSNDIVIDHPTVSAQHASLTKSPTGYHLIDVGSTNGTQINGVSITDAELHDGNEIRFGHVTGHFQDTTGGIDPERELQVSDKHDSPEQLGASQTQSIFEPHV